MIRSGARSRRGLDSGPEGEGEVCFVVSEPLPVRLRCVALRFAETGDTIVL